MSSAFKNLTSAAQTGATNVGTQAGKIAGQTFEGALDAGAGGLGIGWAPDFMTAGSGIKFGATSLPNRLSNFATSTFGDIGTNIATGVKNLNPFSETATLVGGLPEGPITDAIPDFIGQRSPGTIALGGLALKTMATPPPAPAPFAPMQPPPARDFSKYGYKGPLNRGDYTYADPEDIAYGRVTPGSYGYLGAKEGGPIKLSGGGVGSGMMQYGPYNLQIEKTKGTFRPTGSMVAPEAGPAISRIAQTQPMMSVSPQKIAGLAQPVAPTVPTTNVPMAQPKAPTPMPMPQPQQGGMEEQAQQLIADLPQKDISVNIDQIRQFIGLAEGGEVPTTEKEFARLGIYKRPEDYNTKEMAEGGEVQSNETLQSNAFVIPADVVGHIGDGSSDAGAQRLQSFLGMNPQQYQAGGIMAGELQGPGGGMDDLIQTSIEGKRAAAVSPQEFVVPRDIVAELGQGSYDKGSNKLYALMRNVRKAKTGTTKQPAELTRGLGQLMRTAVA